LGGVRFLGGIERALQLRYRVGLSDGMSLMSGLPILRLPLGENPSPEDLRARHDRRALRGVEADMAGAIEALDRIEDSDAVGRGNRHRDLWF
jgi:hypothetical protein